MKSTNSLIKKPSSLLPIAMSLAALSLVVGHVAIFGINQNPQADEGTAAHLFQLFMAGQVPIMAYFIIKWLPKMPKQALQILVLQILAALLAFTPVYFLEM